MSLANLRTPVHLESYFMRVNDGITRILQRPEKNEIAFDILDSDQDVTNALQCLKTKHRQMKYGEIWQVVIGEYPSFQNLKVGHPSGLDILSEDRKIIMELKNRYNTDNASSRETNMKKLVKFKRDHPEYICIYGLINDKKLEGQIKSVTFEETEITFYSGQCLFNFIFGDDTTCILEFVKKTMRDVSTSTAHLT